MIPLLIVLIVVGVILYLLKSRIDPTIYTLILIIVILAVCLYLANMFGLWSGGPKLTK